MRSKEELKELAELALAFSVPNMTAAKQPKSILQSLFTKMQIEFGKEIKRYGLISELEKDYLDKRLEKFGKATGWASNAKHIGTVLSFSVALIERRTELRPKVLRSLNNVATHLEESGDLKTQCCWAGSLAMEKWDAIFLDAPQPDDDSTDAVLLSKGSILSAGGSRLAATIKAHKLQDPSEFGSS